MDNQPNEPGLSPNMQSQVRGRECWTIVARIERTFMRCDASEWATRSNLKLETSCIFVYERLRLRSVYRGARVLRASLIM